MLFLLLLFLNSTPYAVQAAALTQPCGDDACNLTLGSSCSEMNLYNNFNGECCSLSELGEDDCLLKVSSGGCTRSSRLNPMSVEYIDGELTQGAVGGSVISYLTRSTEACPVSAVTTYNSSESSFLVQMNIVLVGSEMSKDDAFVSAWGDATSAYFTQYYQENPSPTVTDLIGDFRLYFNTTLNDTAVLWEFSAQIAWRWPAAAGSTDDVDLASIISEPFVDGGEVYLESLAALEVTDFDFLNKTEAAPVAAPVSRETSATVAYPGCGFFFVAMLGMMMTIVSL